MNEYKEFIKPKTQKKLKIIILENKDTNITWKIRHYKNSDEMPILENSSGYDLNNGNLNLYIEVVKLIISKLNDKKYNEEEIIILKKVIYQYLKLEVLYRRNETSTILEILKSNKELTNYYEETLQKEINEIFSSSYANIEITNLLIRTMKLKETLLNEEVLRVVLMLKEPDLVIKINDELIELSQTKIEYNNILLKEIKRDLPYQYKSLTIHQRKKRIKSAIITLHSLWVLMSSSLLIGVGVKATKAINNGGPREYNAQIETISSLGERNTEYFYIRNRNITRIMEVYSKTYEKDGLYYKDVKSYDISSYEETDDLNKYYSLDMDFLGISPLEIKTIDATNLDNREYKTVKNFIINEEDTKIIRDTTNNTVRTVLNIVIYFVLICLACGYEYMPLQEISKIIGLYNEISEQKKNYRVSLNELIEILKNVDKYIKSNNIDLKAIINYFEELDELKNLTEEEKELLNTIKKSVEDNNWENDETFINIKRKLKKHLS